MAAGSGRSPCALSKAMAHPRLKGLDLSRAKIVLLIFKINASFNLYYSFESDISHQIFSMTDAESIKKVKALSSKRGTPFTLNVSRNVRAHCY